MSIVYMCKIFDYEIFVIVESGTVWAALFLSKKVLIYGKIGSLLYEEISCQTSLKF